MNVCEKNCSKVDTRRQHVSSRWSVVLIRSHHSSSVDKWSFFKMHQLMLNLLHFSQLFIIQVIVSEIDQSHEVIYFRLPVMTPPATKFQCFQAPSCSDFFKLRWTAVKNMRVQVTCWKNDKFMIQNVFILDKQTNDDDFQNSWISKIISNFHFSFQCREKKNFHWKIES